ncbi:MAG TPA: hypothetical protein VM821_00680, partial [Abditibacteriaceae bacterium]|nr:hypothetical protein [Abditibacteriaceae bacterium]
SAPTSATAKVVVADSLISNATPQEMSVLWARLTNLATLLAARDANALQIFGLQPDTPTATAPPKVLATTTRRAVKTPVVPAVAFSETPVTITLSRLAVSPTGALLRVTLEMSSAPLRSVDGEVANASQAQPHSTTPGKASPVRSFDLWFERNPSEGFVLTSNVWPIARDAVDVMSEEADKHWRAGANADDGLREAGNMTSPEPFVQNAVDNGSAPSFAPVSTRTAGAPATNGEILDLVAEYRGGQWLLLRASAPWHGVLLDDQSLARAALQMQQLQTSSAPSTESSKAPGSTADKAASSSSTRIAVGGGATSGATTSSATRNSAAPSRNPLKVREQAAAQFGDLGKTRNAPLWSVRPWLLAQMNRYRKRAAGTAHFIFQRSADGWVGIDSVFEAAREAPDPAYSVAENAARRLRLQMEGESALSAVSHRDFALSLSRVQLLSEAADEIAKARLMQPDLVSDKQFREVVAKRVLDPQTRAQAQRSALASVGFAPEHPTLRVPQLLAQFRETPSPLTALRLGLEYSRLGYEREAQTSLNYGLTNAATFWSLETTTDVDRAWFGVLRDQLKARLALSASKPPNTVRSDLFTVRCSLNDPNAPQLLAGLETAQYQIYSSFGVPMGNTEVILWSSQGQFQGYTTRQAGRHTSEFVTALTITQLVNADVGPVVLGEEINFFADARADSISTIAHEYGHIAVRALAKGRPVPDWLNEGIATYTEGGYENYLRRVRVARQSGKLLSMRELQTWNVDGDRAFLAYSQANSMIDFIVARWGNDAVLEILRQVGRDIAPEVALRRVLRVTPDGFYTLWLKNGIK